MSALDDVQTTALKAASARAEFEQAIRDAHKIGHTLREIAEVAGLSHGRIHQIVQGK